jgi:hypothetical protein
MTAVHRRRNNVAVIGHEQKDACHCAASTGNMRSACNVALKE